MEGTQDSGRPTLDAAVERLIAPRGSRVMLAVSGGADSVAMLRSFVRVAPKRGWTLLIGHVNHGLRGRASYDDELFVRQLARQFALELRVAMVPAAAYAQSHHLSLETAARETRYAALGSMLDAWAAAVLAIAHTMDDQAETLLLHLLRGAGLAGLGGMREQRGPLFRPFLGIRRETVLQALQEDRQGYRVDESNSDEKHARAKLRRTVFPVLKGLQPEPVAVLARSAALLRDDADLLLRQAEETAEALQLRPSESGVAIPRAAVAALHPALRRTLIRLLVERVRGDLHDVSAAHVESIDTVLCAPPSGSVRPQGLPSRLTLTVEPAHVRLHSRTAEGGAIPGDREVALPGETALSSGTLYTEMVQGVDEEEVARWLAVSGPYHALCDARTLRAPVIAGSRRNGDRLRPIGMGGTKKLQDIFVDRHIPASVRDTMIVLRNEDHVVWVPGIALDERVALREPAKPSIHLYFRPNVSVFPC